MRDTKPQRESASAWSYRSVPGTTLTTAPELAKLAEAALIVLARDGGRADGGANPEDFTWWATTETPGGVKFDISCTGPDLPATIPAETVHPGIIPKQRLWVGTYRLVVAAPLVAFDICWRPDEPLRIMSFSRGDWEEALLSKVG